MEKLQDQNNYTSSQYLQTYRPSPDALLNPLADPTFKTLFTDSSPEAHCALTCFLTDIRRRKRLYKLLHAKEPEWSENCRNAQCYLYGIT